MKLNRKNKKGFTIVELVIVIAVIGILAAILIPTFTNLTKNAQDAARREELQNAYVAYVMDGSDDTPFAILPREQVALERNKTGETGKYYTFDAEKGQWNVTTVTTKGAASGSAEGYIGYLVYAKE